MAHRTRTSFLHSFLLLAFLSIVPQVYPLSFISFRWCASMLFLVFLSFFSLLVSILGIPLSCLQMVYVEHDPANKLTKIIPLGVLKKNCIVLKRLEIQDGCPGLWLAEIFRLHQNLPEMFLLVSSRSVVVFQSNSKSNMAVPASIGWDVFYFVFQNYFIWSHQTFHRCSCKGSEEVLLVFGIQDGHPDLWLAETFLTSFPEKLHAMSPIPYLMFFFVFSRLRWELVVRFVDIGEIIDNHRI